MKNYRENIQNYITFLQENRIKISSKTPLTFLCGGFIAFISMFLAIISYLDTLKSWWAIIFLLTFYIAIIVASSFIKDNYKKLFFKVEFLGISFFSAIIVISITLSRLLFNNLLYLALASVIFLIVGCVITQTKFMKRIKTDYYKSPKTSKNISKGGMGIAIILSFSVPLMSKILPDQVTFFLLSTILLFIGGICGALIFSNFRNIYFVLHFGFNLQPRKTGDGSLS